MINFESTLPPLRDYQKIIKETSNSLSSNHVIQSPTGTGKGNLIIDMISDDIRNVRPVLVVVPSLELIFNLQERLKTYAPFLDEICSYVGTGLGKNFNAPFVIGVYKTISLNLSKLSYFSKVYFDEVHHSASETNQKIIKHYPNSQHIGFTATPSRLDGKPLGDNFTDLITSPSPRWFIEQGYLADYSLKTIGNLTFSQHSFDDNLSLQQKMLDNKELMGDIVKNWMENANFGKTIVFATGIAHAVHLRDTFNETLSKHGHSGRFEVLHSKQNFKERKAILEAFKNGELIGLTNITIILEGVDVPDAEVCIWARHTQSLTLYLQGCGRVLRPKPGKVAQIYDHAGNSLQHGLPCFEHDWSLEGMERLEPSDKCLCKACGMPLMLKSKLSKFGDEGVSLVCPVCSYPNHFRLSAPILRLPRLEVPNQREGELVEMTIDQDEFRLYKIITNKQPRQKKIAAILKLKVDKELKRKGLKMLDMEEGSINIYLKKA
jgi:superfamily II DNA or RNA helicase